VVTPDPRITRQAVLSVVEGHHVPERYWSAVLVELDRLAADLRERIAEHERREAEA
jgi:hypothetical protein